MSGSDSWKKKIYNVNTIVNVYDVSYNWMNVYCNILVEQDDNNEIITFIVVLYNDILCTYKAEYKTYIPNILKSR